MVLLPPTTQLLAIGLLNWSDDEGYFLADQRLIRGALFPFHESSVIVTGGLRELCGIDYCRIGLGSDGRLYGWIVNFHIHQKISKPQKSKMAELCNFPEPFQYHSGNVPVTLPVGMEWNGMERNGKEELLATQTAALKQPDILFENDNSTSSEKTTSTPKSNKRPAKPKPDKPPRKCDPFAVWIKGCKQQGHFDFVPSEFEKQYIDELGRMYDGETLMAMIKAYGKWMRETDRTRPWRLWDFYKDRNRWNAESYNFRAVLDPNSEEALNALAGGK